MMAAFLMTIGTQAPTWDQKDPCHAQPCISPDLAGRDLMTAPAPELAVAYARSKIGDWYLWGAEGPHRFDCSGLTWASYYYGAGVHWTRTTADVEITRGVPVARHDLQIGDLVQPHPGHIQLYAGDGRIIEAPKTGTRIREVPMWGFHRACRIAGGGHDHGGGGGGGGRPYPGHYIQFGSRGPAVRLVQAIAKTSVDGVFGHHTKAAVKRYQQAHHLEVDGQVGPLSWKAMFG